MQHINEFQNILYESINKKDNLIMKLDNETNAKEED